MYQAAHITGTERYEPVHDLDNAVRVARQAAMRHPQGHRYAVLEANTDNVVAVAWPDGGVDYQAKPYPTL
jgi:hypothetical protein